MSQLWRNLPKAFLTHLKAIVPNDVLPAVLEAYTKDRPTTLRVNTIKSSLPELRDIFQKHTISFEESQTIPLAFIIHSEKQKLLALDAYKKGMFYIQGLSSMLPVLHLDPKPNEKILDIAAAPGSKTTQIAALMNNTGEIVAIDNSRIRSYTLQANLHTQGVTNTKMLVQSGQTIWQTYPEYFDRSLVDAPCSGEGTFTIHDPKTYNHWSLKNCKEYVEKQKWLLRSAVSSTKVGGVIVYSTCTLEPAENTGVVEWMLKKEKNAIRLSEKPIMIYPSDLYEGFFIAKFIKYQSTVKGLS